ncbi:MAG TPA: sigma-70 family RNA polymerase sigma factor [Polyangiales bacterium]|nr:sigma-70 family RNA polymerase sigma factor [Polyangiales bacterium]
MLPSPLAARHARSSGAFMVDAIDPLVRLVQRGDEQAKNELFKRYQKEVARIAARTLGPDADLEDVVQEAFIQIFRSIDSFRGSAKFSTWLYRLVTNVTRMHLRKRRVRPQIADGVPPELAMRHDDGSSPEQAAERSFRVRRLYQHLDRLSEKKRMVLVLHDFEGLLPVEIAEIVEAPVLTVRTRLFYARRELYAALATDPELSALAAELSAASGPTGNDKGRR